LASGARRLLADPALLEGASDLHAVLTHFHFDHVCGLPYLPWLRLPATIWAPGGWLYDTDSAEILAPLRRPPISPSDQTEAIPVNELEPAGQLIGGFEVRVSPQLRHWAPSAGIRIEDHLAFVTDTPYEPSSAELAKGVAHLLHEAWSSSAAPVFPDRDATAADAGRVAQEADVGDLTLIHLNPTMEDLSPLLHDAVTTFERVALGEDEMRIS
jgi:ribonuclease BN (tRNA processing enzyme)